MKKNVLTPTTKGNLIDKKMTIGITVFGLILTAGLAYIYMHMSPNKAKKSPTQKAQKNESTIAKDVVNYVFTSIHGKPVTIGEKDVYTIKQMYDDGVLPTVIAEKYNMSAIMVSRIINSIK